MFTRTIIQAMTYIEVIGVKITENVFQRHLIIIKTSYRHLEESF